MPSTKVTSRGERPVTEEELGTAKAALIASLPEQLASVDGIVRMVNTVYNNGLPEDYWSRYQAGIKAVTAADVQRGV